MAELPLLLAGRDPQSISGNDVGTHNYTQAPRAVIFGRGYELEDINKFRQACANCAIEPIAWVVGDPAYRPDLNARPPGPGYAKVVADTVRGALDKWKKTGALKDEVFLY